MEEKKKKQTPAKKEYDKKYRREKMFCASFRLSRINDRDLIDIYEKIPNKVEWFRECIRNTGNEKTG